MNWASYELYPWPKHITDFSDAALAETGFVHIEPSKRVRVIDTHTEAVTYSFFKRML